MGADAIIVTIEIASIRRITALPFEAGRRIPHHGNTVAACRSRKGDKTAAGRR